MFTPEEIALLKKNPETAALGEKLEKEQWIPKSRFDEVNQKAKEATETLAKKLEEEKKVSESKQIEDGKVKELLAQRDTELEKSRKEKEELLAQNKTYEQSQAKIRENALSKIKDLEFKKVAEKLPTVEDVLDFTEKLITKKISTFTDKISPGQSEPIKYKSAREWEQDLRSKGLA